MKQRFKKFLRQRKLLLILALVAIFLTVTAASCGSESAASKKASGAAHTEQAAVANSLDNMLKSQPIPARPWSQLRQNLIEIQTSQMDTTQTTTFFFNQGVQVPVMSCPSIGFPIETTAQLTNPQQIIQDQGNQNGGNVPIPQIDPPGVYSGSDSTGTYAMCINAKGEAYAVYWEGFVQTVTGPATWLKDHVELTGPPSFAFTKGK